MMIGRGRGYGHAIGSQGGVLNGFSDAITEEDNTLNVIVEEDNEMNYLVIEETL